MHALLTFPSPQPVYEDATCWCDSAGFFTFSLLLLQTASFIRSEINRSPDFSLDYSETEFLQAGILQPGALIPEESTHMGAEADRQAFHSSTRSNNSDQAVRNQNTALVMFQACFWRIL